MHRLHFLLVGFLVVSSASYGYAQSETDRTTIDQPDTQNFLTTETVNLTLTQTNLSSQVLEIFQNKCSKCHTPDAEKVGGDFDFLLDLNRLAKSKEYIVPGEPDESELFLIIDDNEMPPRKSKLGPISDTNKQIIKQWITLGALVPISEHALPITNTTQPNITNATNNAVNKAINEEIHDKATDETTTPVTWDNVFAWVGNFHPPTIHFPVAMLIGALLAECFFAITGHESLKTVVRFCLWIGFLGALIAAPLGWAKSEYGVYINPTKQWTLLYHRWLGVGTTCWALVSLIISEWRCRRECPLNQKALRLTLFIGAMLVSATGLFGGALVFGWDHYAW